LLSVDIDHTLSKRMEATHAQLPPVQPPPQFTSGSSSSFTDPYSAILNQLGDLSLSSAAVTEKILASQEDLRNEYRNDMSYVCSAI